MIEDYQDAIRQILSVIDAAWAPTGHVINYPGKTEAVPSGSSPWARVTVRHTKSEQRSIPRAGQIYTGNGILIVQVFTPLGDGISSTLKANLVKIVQNALRGQDTPGGLFFMEVTPEEVGQSGHWYQTNVSARWQYDERLTT